MRHSSTSPNQQRRPLPSLLSLSSSMLSPLTTDKKLDSFHHSSLTADTRWQRSSEQVQQLSQGGRSMAAAWQLQDNCMTSEQLSSEWQLSVQAAWVILSKPFKTNSVVSRDHCQFCNSYEAITKWTKVSKHLIVITWKEIRNVVSCKSSWLAVMV